MGRWAVDEWMGDGLAGGWTLDGWVKGWLGHWTSSMFRILLGCLQVQSRPPLILLKRRKVIPECVGYESGVRNFRVTHKEVIH